MFNDLDGTHPSIELPNDDHKKQIPKKGINMFPLITVSKPPNCFCQIFAKRHHEASCDDENDFFPSLHFFHKIKKQSG
jgi:hypothetical protein